MKRAGDATGGTKEGAYGVALKSKALRDVAVTDDHTFRDGIIYAWCPLEKDVSEEGCVRDRLQIRHA